MAKKTIKAQMKQRRDTQANWASTNPVLLDGELGIVSDDPNLYKVGDGTTAWNSLPFRGFDGTLAQELGTSPNAVISQKVVSEKLTELESEVGDMNWEYLNGEKTFPVDIKAVDATYDVNIALKGGQKYSIFFKSNGHMKADVTVFENTTQGNSRRINIDTLYDYTPTTDITKLVLYIRASYVISAGVIDMTLTRTDTAITKLASKEEVSSLGVYEDVNGYARLYTDAEGKFLFGIKDDGSIEWALGVPEPIKIEIEKLEKGKVSKEEGKSLISANIAESLDSIDDYEERTEMTLDADGKVVSYRDKNGVRHELGGLQLNQRDLERYAKYFDGASQVVEDGMVYVDRPKFCEIHFDKTPPSKKNTTTTKYTVTDVDIKMILDKRCILHAKCNLEVQGQGSSAYNKKGYTLDFLNAAGEELKVKFGNMPAVDSYHLKAFATDMTHARNVGNINVWRMIVKNLGYPYCIVNNKPYNISADQDVNDIRYSDARYGEDGFPCAVYVDGAFWGLYTLKLKKTRDNYAMSKKNNSEIFLDSVSTSAFLHEPFNYADWEVKNPKMSGYEIIEHDDRDEGVPIPVESVRLACERLFQFTSSISEATKSSAEDYIVLKNWLAYYIFCEVIGHIDADGNNTELYTWDGVHWTILPYDTDLTLGFSTSNNKLTILSEYKEFAFHMTNSFWIKLRTIFASELKQMYTEFRKTFLNAQNMNAIYEDQVSCIPREVYEKDFEKWGTVWSNGIPTMQQIAVYVNNRLNWLDEQWLIK